MRSVDSFGGELRRGVLEGLARRRPPQEPQPEPRRPVVEGGAKEAAAVVLRASKGGWEG